MRGGWVLLLACGLAASEGEDGTCQANTEETCGEGRVNGSLPEVEPAEYAKQRWTDSTDWPIREELDAADDLIASEPAQAVDLFKGILARHPDSARAGYALARSCQVLLWRAEEAEERAALCDTALGSLRILLGREGVIEAIRANAGSFMLTLAEGLCKGSRADVVMALQVVTEKEEMMLSRYGLVLVHELFLSGLWEETGRLIERIAGNDLTHFQLNLIKSTMMKVRGDGEQDVKAANRLLREVDWEDEVDQKDINADEARQALGQVITDLNYLGRELAREGRQADSRILFQDASRLHLVPSPLQRPVDPLPGLQARPLWDLAQLRAQNRWTSASALTGLGLAGAPLARLEEQAEELAREAAALAEGAGKDPAWRREGHQMELAGAAYTRGLYAWGKKRHETCSHAARACKLIKQFPDSAKCRKCLSKYLVVEAGGRLVPRVGPTNTRLRAVLPLEVPRGGARLTVGGQDVQLQRGKLVVMDDSFENSVWNESAEGSLLLLLVDFHHPDLNDRQKKLAYSEQGQNQFAMY